MNRNKKAGDLQDRVTSADLDQLKHGYGLYDEDRVRQATIHTRQDLVMVVSHLSSIGDLLAFIRALLVVIAIAAVVVATVMVWPYLS